MENFNLKLNLNKELPSSLMKIKRCNKFKMRLQIRIHPKQTYAIKKNIIKYFVQEIKLNVQLILHPNPKHLLHQQ
jgi:hypothetical protein